MNDCIITFTEAVREESVVAFEYSKPTDPNPQRRIFSPWEIDEAHNTVLGYDHDREGVRKFTMANAFNLRPYEEDSYVRPAI